MLVFILVFIISIPALRATYSYLRRKLAKPNYTDQTVWITGASSGIGEYLAYEFNRVGAYVVLSSRSTDELRRVKEACPHPENAEILALDIADFAAVRKTTKQFMGKLEASGKRLDVLVENAGMSMISDFVNASFENHSRLFDVNVHGPFNHIQAVVPHMLKNKGGTVVGVTSLATKAAQPYRMSYNSSKCAFLGILDTIRSELEPQGVRICNIMPGYIRTNLSKNAFLSAAGEKFGKTNANLKGGMDPNDFARQAVAAIYNKEREAGIYKGWLPTIVIFFRNLLPDLAFILLNINAKAQKKALEDSKND